MRELTNKVSFNSDTAYLSTIIKWHERFALNNILIPCIKLRYSDSYCVQLAAGITRH